MAHNLFDPLSKGDILTTPAANVAVIGAGLAGLTCAVRLKEGGCKVTVFEQSGTVGGRMTSLSIPVADDAVVSFDHGAQYFTARHEYLQAATDAWVKSGIAAIWEGRIRVLNRGFIAPTDQPLVRYVGVPSMGAICERLAQDCDIHLNRRVQEVEQRDGRWSIYSEKDLGSFDIVALALPPPRAAELLVGVPSLHLRIAGVSMLGSWAGLIGFNEPLPLELDGAFVHDSGLSWIARNSSKPGRIGDLDSWVIHGSGAWSQSKIDLSSDEALATLLDEFWIATGLPPREPQLASVFRWHWALAPEPLTVDCFFEEPLGIGVCGDWCAGSRVEGAFRSGLALADQILANV